jgi:hypothetical protein
VRDLRFLDDDDRMKTTIGLTKFDDDWMKTTIGLIEFALKAMILGTCLTKRQMGCGEELEEACNSRKDCFSRTLLSLSQRKIAEDNGSRDLLS